MGTRSFIGAHVYTTDGPQIAAIYCHWDGYPEHNGAILLNHYTSTESVHALLQPGDLSILGTTPGEKHAFDARSENNESGHAKQCTYYGRDRGEKNTEAEYLATMQEFLDTADSRDAEWWYLYVPKVGWLYGSVRGTERGFLADCPKLKAQA